MKRLAAAAAVFAAALGGSTLLSTPVSAPAPCHSVNGQPDPVCTPGAVDPAVTQDNLAHTVCVAGYTARVRPPVSYTAPLKRELMTRYGYAGDPSAYELDHLIPLAVGGSPRAQANLWPQPWPEAKLKDRLEDQTHADLCAGKLTLVEAQARFLSSR